MKRLPPLPERSLGGDHFTASDTWRVWRIVAELVEAFEALSWLDRPAVAIFGSSRLGPDSPYYEMGRTLAEQLVHAGYAVITGGGPGLMEAANRGALEAGGVSAGLNIRLPEEQPANSYQNLSLEFRYFFIRKLCLVKYSRAFVALPGGYGTLDEVTEALTLVQTGRISPHPIYLMGSRFWQGLIDWFREVLVAGNFIAPEHLDLFRVSDSVEEVVADIVARCPAPQPAPAPTLPPATNGLRDDSLAAG
jgi:uncharacterized protein (TIGR00730 family)